MDIFDVLTLIGGLCLFLFGMSVMGDSLERAAGNSLRTILGKLTNNRMMGFLTGLVWEMSPFIVYICLRIDFVIKSIWCVHLLQCPLHK